MNGQARRRARRLPIVVLPAPETPIRTTIIASLLPSDRVSSETGTHHGEEASLVVGASLTRESAHQCERHDGRWHAELDRLERRPAALARIGDHRRDARKGLVVFQ